VTKINELNAVDTLKDDDLMPVWSGSTRSVSALKLSDYLVTKVLQTLFPVAMAADIASVNSPINKSGKFAGRFVWDTTNNRLLRAEGSAVAAAWYVVDGSASVTPS
jgi:hypothetical protein